MGNLSNKFEKLEDVFESLKNAKHKKSGRFFSQQEEKSGLKKLMELLINGSLKANTKDRDGHTLLHYSLYCFPENLELIKGLLVHGASVKERNIYSQTALHVANYNKITLEVLQELLSYKPDLNAKDINGDILLHCAFSRNLENIDLIKIILKHGACVTEKNSLGQTPLHIAAYSCDRVDVIHELLLYGADVTAKDMIGDTPLHCALYTFPGNVEKIRMLLKHEAFIHDKNILEQTPLHVAASSGMSLDIIKELLNKGSEVNVQDDEGNSPLHLALLTHLENVNPFSQLHCCLLTRSSFLNTFKEFLNQDNKAHNLNSDKEIVNNNVFPNLQVIKELLKHGASVHERNKIGHTPLEIATLYKINAAIIKELLKYYIIEHPIHMNNILSLSQTYENLVLDFTNEINKMKEDHIVNKLTLYDFVILRNNYGKHFSHEQDILSEFVNFEQKVSINYPHYHEIILRRLETREYLLEKFCDIPISIEIDGVICKVITINQDCIYKIASYLSNEDLKNFLHAFTKNC